MSSLVDLPDGTEVRILKIDKFDEKYHAKYDAPIGSIVTRQSGLHDDTWVAKFINPDGVQVFLDNQALDTGAVELIFNAAGVAK